jgi:hypothetical protein
MTTAAAPSINMMIQKRDSIDKKDETEQVISLIPLNAAFLEQGLKHLFE